MNKIYVCSDLHGCFDLYEQINNFILPDDTVIFLGDAVDRGPYSYETMEAIRTNPQWIYLKGNHEAMLEDAINEKLNPDSSVPFNFSYIYCINNGAEDKGESAYHQIIKNNQLQEYSNFFANEMFLHYTIDNAKTGIRVILTHAGYTPLPDKDPETYLEDEDLFWDRTHFLDNIPQEKMDMPTIIIHGHTPTVFLIEEVSECQKFGDPKFPLCRYGNGKIDIDAGSFSSGIAYLVDITDITLDHMNFKTFYSKEVD